MRRLVLLLCTLAGLAACHHDNDKTTPAKRTVMVYMAGENNLTAANGTRFLKNDLDEIIEGSKLLADDQRLLVFIDSMVTNKADAQKEGEGKPCIIEVHGGKRETRYVFDHEFYSSDPAYFRQVLEWMTQNAPADDYGLVLWGHACGWAVSADTIAQARTAKRAYGQDDGSDVGGSLKWMNITQMAKAMEGLPQLHFIFADCCDMMCAEVGYELRNATRYLIGSPAEIPGDGAPYHKIIPYLYGNDSDLYRNVINAYYEYYLDDFKGDRDLDGYSVPLSVIDTRYIGDLANATHDILGTFVPQMPDNPALSGIAFYWYYDAPLMYDMKAVIRQNASEADYNNWVKTFEQAVPYNRMSMRWMTIYSRLENSFAGFNQDESMYGCVSMYIPRNLSSYWGGTFRYNATSNNMAWNRVMDWSRFGW